MPVKLGKYSPSPAKGWICHEVAKTGQWYKPAVFCCNIIINSENASQLRIYSNLAHSRLRGSDNEEDKERTVENIEKMD
ncbi:MAG: hypothetical protein FWE93_03230 [Alphaproteobacteria bacterium]|nr:hypothetical protein [Alphaproteobacteria bacterium]